MHLRALLLTLAFLLLPLLGAQPAQAPSASGQVISSVKTDEKVVALTFDDGPDPRYTPLVLQLAREKGVRFTFFLVGKQAERHPDLVAQILAGGHAVGNHTWDHRVLWGERRAVDAWQIQRCGTTLQRLTGEKPQLFRPPDGQMDALTRLVARRLGYQIILWSASVGERSPQQPAAMASRILAKDLSGAIILAHDGDPTGHRLNRLPSLQAVALIVDELQRRGYRFLTVPELLALGEQQQAGRTTPAPPEPPA